VRTALILEEFSHRVDELEAVLQKVATDIASGVLLERVQPADLWNKSEASVTLLKMLAENCRETMTLLKPEKALALEQRFRALTQPLNVFKDILFQKTSDPLANSRLAFEQLRKALMEGSDFLVLAREIRRNPSPAIQEILRLREEEGGVKELARVVSVPETQLTRADLLGQIEALRLSVAGVERALSEVKERLGNVEESLKAASASLETEASQKEPTKKQLSLSQF